jgi:hypothetical protein
VFSLRLQSAWKASGGRALSTVKLQRSAPIAVGFADAQ